VLERRGYGATATGSRPCRYRDQVADLATVVGEVDEPVMLFGHSFGGIVSMG
jgi:pimeloyl-ACP methyl ester carboxylesterase